MPGLQYHLIGHFATSEENCRSLSYFLAFRSFQHFDLCYYYYYTPAHYIYKRLCFESSPRRRKKQTILFAFLFIFFFAFFFICFCFEESRITFVSFSIRKILEHKVEMERKSSVKQRIYLHSNIKKYTRMGRM